MKRKLILITALVTLGLSVIFALPDPPPPAASACLMDWPARLDGWIKMREKEPSAKEIAVLTGAKFSKADYVASPGSFQIDAGIVMSTTDINETIHRPERCLPAQGHQILKSTTQEISLPNGFSIPLTRLHTRLKGKRPATDEQPAEEFSYDCITYYWFIGKSTLTSSHYVRTFSDIAYRLKTGGTQRWAYVTVAAYLPAPPSPDSPSPVDDPSNPIDKNIQDFIKKSAPSIIDFEAIKK